jgi:hypothetical protein
VSTVKFAEFCFPTINGFNGLDTLLRNSCSIQHFTHNIANTPAKSPAAAAA